VSTPASSVPRALRTVDAHHHLWRYTPADFGWLTDEMASLRRDFLPADLVDALASASVDATVAVQARQSLEETDFLLACAAATPAIVGVVGWVPLTSPELPGILDRLSNNPRLAGVREIAQGQPAGFLDDPALNAGIAQLTPRSLTYDILIYEHQLPEAIRLVDRHPAQSFILDHAAKPRIASGDLEPWATHLRELARRPNVTCKLSGLVTEAHWHTWSPDTLRPFLDLCAEAFGPRRLLAGSDWPVCLVASSYARWWTVLRSYFAFFSAEEQSRIFAANAIETYRLQS
jgi:L-fuconolactonase